MPEWLLKEENYNPQSDKDTFVNKSILSLLGILSRVKTQSGYTKDLFHVNVDLKVVFTFMLIVLLSISRSLTFVISHQIIVVEVNRIAC
jgi:cobalt/nickel transport system permease protein